MRRLAGPLCVLVTALLATSCGAGGDGASQVAGPAPPAGPVTSGVTTSTVASALWKAPKAPCKVVPAGLAARLGMTGPRPSKGGLSSGCRWTLSSDRQRVRSLVLEYEASASASLVKTLYDRLKQTDLRSGGGLGMRVLERAPQVRQIGSKARGTDFDEGYYFYGHEEVVPGLETGVGTIVLRRANLKVRLAYRGATRTSAPGTRLTTRPDPSAAAKEIIDAVADPAVEAVVRA